MEKLDLEKIVIEFEKKTNISREDVFSWVGVHKENTNNINWIKPIVDSINTCLLYLNKRQVSFSNSQQLNIAKNINEVCDFKNLDKEDCVKFVVNCINWKCVQCKSNKNESKYFNKDFFTRARKNNFKNLIYFYEQWISEHPLSKKEFTIFLEDKKTPENRKKSNVRVKQNKPICNTNQSVVQEDELGMF